MIDPAVLSSPWFVAIASSLVTAIVIVTVKFLSTWLKSRFGMFSGQYMALTWTRDDSEVLLEDVSCRHVGNTLTGRIRGVAVLRRKPESHEVEEVAPNGGLYRFSGSVQERVFVVSYRTCIRALNSAGAIALLGDHSGTIFLGSWAGLDQGKVQHARCVWFVLHPRISSRRQREAFLDMARNYVAFGATGSDPNQLPSKLLCMAQRYGKPGMGKSAVLASMLGKASLEVPVASKIRVYEDPSTGESSLVPIMYEKLPRRSSESFYDDESDEPEENPQQPDASDVE